LRKIIDDATGRDQVNGNEDGRRNRREVIEGSIYMGIATYGAGIREIYSWNVKCNCNALDVTELR